ncbi:hypothetical protein [Duganella sp. Root1480D1]|uniref:hypothetical protein n=1 Tax=Duganella sp. Root1480D1 TaxID=1736471 RepID=UPI00070B46CC|nr:hypothetical protein [Duganella sp. Root1480D1]KQZ32665.1 hypothetical protein ASD58_08585 [Duganella sp. Root1480D1]
MRAAIFAASLLAALLPAAAMACQCSDPALAEAVAGSKYVYIGTVMSGRMVKGGSSYIESVIQAHRIAKGEIQAGNRTVATGINSCSTPLAVGHTYMVFESEGGYVNAMCTGTAIIHRSKEDEFMRKVKDVSNER